MPLPFNCLLSRLGVHKLVADGVHFDIFGVINIQELFVDIRAFRSGQNKLWVIFTGLVGNLYGYPRDTRRQNKVVAKYNPPSPLLNSIDGVLPFGRVVWRHHRWTNDNRYECYGPHPRQASPQTVSSKSDHQSVSCPDRSP